MDDNKNFTSRVDSSEYADSASIDNHGRTQSGDITFNIPLLPKVPAVSVQSSNVHYEDNPIEPRKAAVDARHRVTFLLCLLHLAPVAIVAFILFLNAKGVYWQDLGGPHQNAKLQALQYAAKGHEMMMVYSITCIVIHRIQFGLSVSKGVPLGLLSAGSSIGDLSFVLDKGFWGGVMASNREKGLGRYLPLPVLIFMSIVLAAVVGPSSAVAMIPRLDWWDVSRQTAFGSQYHDRLYFHHSAEELWPAEINNTIYANTSLCSANNTENQDCAVRAMDQVLPWVQLRQDQGTKPNITVFQDFELTRYITSQGGPPESSSWTVASTVPYPLARDLYNFWDWMVENGTLSTTIDQPLIKPSFVDPPSLKMMKPVVQTQCHSYLYPDFRNGIFEFPHDELKTPPLDGYLNDTWALPNEFIMNLQANQSKFDRNYTTNATSSSPWLLFNWYDIGSTLSSKGPSLGAVVIYWTSTGAQFSLSLATCSIDGRWVPFDYFLDPKEGPIITQSSPNPMDILNGKSKQDPTTFIQMKMSLDWANTLNVLGTSTVDPSATVIEQMLDCYGNAGLIDSEPNTAPNSSDAMTSIEWRISTVLGLYLTEGLARAFQDENNGSILYRQASSPADSYVRLMNNVNAPWKIVQYKNGTPDWIQLENSVPDSSYPPWDVWAPANGYTEIGFTVQRYGYGYGFEGVPIKLATTALAFYALLVLGHVMVLLFSRKIYKGYSKPGEMLVLAWNSAAPERGLGNTGAGIEKLSTWRQIVRVRGRDGEHGEDGKHLHFELDHDGRDGEKRGSKPKAGVKYA